MYIKAVTIYIYIFVEPRYYVLLTELAARYIATLEIEVLTNQALTFVKKDKNIKVVTKEDKQKKFDRSFLQFPLCLQF